MYKVKEDKGRQPGKPEDNTKTACVETSIAPTHIRIRASTETPSNSWT